MGLLGQRFVHSPIRFSSEFNVICEGINALINLRTRGSAPPVGAVSHFLGSCSSTCLVVS